MHPDTRAESESGSGQYRLWSSIGEEASDHCCAVLCESTGRPDVLRIRLPGPFRLKALALWRKAMAKCRGGTTIRPGPRFGPRVETAELIKGLVLLRIVSMLDYKARASGQLTVLHTPWSHINTKAKYLRSPTLPTISVILADLPPDFKLI